VLLSRLDCEGSAPEAKESELENENPFFIFGEK
jgi:hypothetical protein